MYVDAGQTTDSELRAWGVAHAPLWAALRARTFAVHVVAVGTGAEAADRAAPVLTRWTQDGDGQGAADPDGPTQADPDIRQEIARLKTALTTGNRQMLREWGTFEKAADRILSLEALPRRHAHQDDGARGHRPLHHLAHRPTDDPRGGDLMVSPVSGPFRGRAQGRAQGSDNGTRKQGGCTKKRRGGVPHPHPFFRRLCSGCSSWTGRPEPRQRRGERRERPPLFDRWARFGEGGVSHPVYHLVYHTPPVVGVAPVLCIPAGRLPGPRAGRATRPTERRDD